MREAVKIASEAEIGRTVQFDKHELGKIVVSMQNKIEVSALTDKTASTHCQIDNT